MKTKLKYNWGIIGAGIIANRMADALQFNPNSQLYAVASKTEEKAKAFAKKHNIEMSLSYEEIVQCKEIDIIYVATTHNFHFENAKLALENNKHVLIEKPFTVSANEAKELVRIATKKNLFLMEAIWTRFLPSIKLLKTKISSGEIGEVRQINISFGGFVGPEYVKRLTDPNLAGGATLDMGIYPISFLCFLLGEVPSDVKSMTRFSDLGVDEISNYLFRFPSGCFASINVSYNLKMKNETQIYGTEGIITVPNFKDGNSFIIHKHNGTNEIVKSIEVNENNHTNGFVYEVEEVVNCINEGKTESEIIPLKETVEIMEVMDKMRNEWGFTYPFE